MKIIQNFIILVLVHTAASQFPSDIDRCHFGDTKCIAETMKAVMQMHPNGHKGLYLPRLEPFQMNVLHLIQGDESPVSIDVRMTNLDLHGFSKFNVERIVGFEEDPRTSKYEVYGTFPLLKVFGHYKSKGRVLFLPVYGDGPMNITLKNLKMSFKSKPKIVEKDGQIFLQADKVKILLEPEGLYYYFGNLFDGNEELSTSMNQFMNENAKEIWTELGDSIGKAVSEIIKTILNSVLTKFTYQDIFLPS